MQSTSDYPILDREREQLIVLLVMNLFAMTSSPRQPTVILFT